MRTAGCATPWRICNDNHERDGSRPGDPDATVTSAWRNASAEQPSSALDRAIIAAAREKGDAALLSEKDKKPGLNFFSRVFRDGSASGHSLARRQPMAAAAAVAGLAFVLVQETAARIGTRPRTKGTVAGCRFDAGRGRSPAARNCDAAARNVFARSNLGTRAPPMTNRRGNPICAS